MQFDLNNKIVKRCAEGMELEGKGLNKKALKLFQQAWQEASSDFEKFTAAHYVARHQSSTEEKLDWDQIALKHALKIDDPSIKATLPSLYLNIGKCYADLNDLKNAQTNYLKAESYLKFLPDDGYGKMIGAGVDNGLKEIKTKLKNTEVLMIETEIRKLIDARVALIKNKSIEEILKTYNNDVISFDVVGKLKYIGIGAVRNRLEEWFSTLQKVKNFEITDIFIDTSGDSGFCSSLNHIDAITTDGNKLNMYWRETVCYAKIEGEIKIVHSHSSVPFDAETGKASINLKPDLVAESAKFDKSKSPVEIAKLSYIAFQNEQREFLEELFSEDFTFSSPIDKNLTKKEFFEICYPFSKEVEKFEFLKVAAVGNDVFVTYRCSAQNQADFINTELVHIENDKITSVRVFFGDE